MKNLKNTLIEFKIKKKKFTIKGVLIDYSDEWTLLLNNPVDYLIDGYILIKNDNIIAYNDLSRSFENKVLIKKTHDIKKINLKLDSIEVLIHYLKRKDILFSVENLSNNSYLLGKAKNINETRKIVVIRPLSPKAKWQKYSEVPLSSIDIIEFNNDYSNSLKMILE